MGSDRLDSAINVRCYISLKKEERVNSWEVKTDIDGSSRFVSCGFPDLADVP
jgi:hypothetical protein